jgi:hypothetical protein
MLFELSKDKSLLSILSKSNLDEATNELINSGASITEIKKSLIDNMDSNNIVKYRQYIKKAEEVEDEQVSLRRKQTKKITDSQFKRIVKLIAETEGISESEVDRTKIPINGDKAKQMITDLKAELKTKKTIGLDSDEDSESADLEGEEQTQPQEGKNNSIQVSENQRIDTLTLENKKKTIAKDLSKSSVWVGELNDLLKKLSISVKDADTKSPKITIKRMAEYQKFGTNITESNEVIGAVLLFEKDEDYFINRYAKYLETMFLNDTEKTHLLVPRKESSKGDGLFVPQIKKIMFVKEINDDWKKITASKIQGVLLSDILKEMHRNAHGKQPIMTRDTSQRKTELQDLQRFISGESPKDAAKFKKLEDKVKSINRSIQKSRVQQSIITDLIKELEEIKSNTDKLVARKIRKLIQGIKSVSSVDKIKGIMDEIKEIQTNPEPYIEELSDKIEKDIEVERMKLETVTNVLLGFEKVSPTLKRVNRALGEVNNLREDTGKEPSGKLKGLLGKLLVHVLRVDRYGRKIQVITNKLPEVAEKSIAEWLLDNIGDTVTFDDGGVNYGGMSDISYEVISNLEDLRDKFDENANDIDSIMNEYDSLVGGDVE